MNGAEAILAAVVFGAQKFMNEVDWEPVLGDWLARLGVATGSSQVRIFRNDDATPGTLTHASMLSQWIAPGVTAGSPPEALQAIPYRAAGCARWEELLERGQAVVGNRDELPASEQPILQQEGCTSIAIVPVFASGRWWGFIGFADCRSTRKWQPAELNALVAAAGIYGAAVSRREMQQRIATATTQEQLGAAIGKAITASAQNLDEVLEACCSSIVEYLHADFVRVWCVGRDGTLRSNSAVSPLLSDFAPSELRIGEYAIGRIAQTREPEVWRDGLPELWADSDGITRAAGLRAGVAQPLLTDDQVMGVVLMLNREPFDPPALEALASVTDEFALAIERFRALAAVHLSEDRYRRLVDATREGICIHDGRRIRDGNPSIAQLFGYELDDIIGRSPLEFVHADSLADVKLKLAANYSAAYEAQMIRRDGSVFPAELKGSDYIYDGEKLRVVSIRDLTERKQAERIAQRLTEAQHAREAAEHSRTNAEFLADASRILASSFDTTTTLNQLAHLAVRFLADYCVVWLLHEDGMEQVALVHADPDRQELLAASMDYWRARWQGHPRFQQLHSGEPVIVQLSDEELDAMTADVEQRAMLEKMRMRSLMSVPIVSGGTLMGTILFSASTARPAYGAEELSLAQELGRRAAVALQSAQSYHDARAATQARDEMLAVVAHDLRNPLNTIYMGSQAALEMLGTEMLPPARRQFEIILRTSEHMNRLIQDLLDATRLVAGQLTLDRAPTPPATVAEEARDILLPLATHAGIALTTEVAEGLPTINADRQRLLQVLSNLIGNALKFTPRGGAVALCVYQDAGQIRFRVTDTGAGIPSDQLSQIFGRFWQARRTDRRGLGLGLAIAKGIVEAHGGVIGVESRVGAGSAFEFSIPT